MYVGMIRRFIVYYRITIFTAIREPLRHGIRLTYGCGDAVYHLIRRYNGDGAEWMPCR
jgi:hypothetical protein